MNKTATKRPKVAPQHRKPPQAVRKSPKRQIRTKTHLPQSHSTLSAPPSISLHKSPFPDHKTRDHLTLLPSTHQSSTSTPHPFSLAQSPFHTPPFRLPKVTPTPPQPFSPQTTLPAHFHPAIPAPSFSSPHTPASHPLFTPKRGFLNAFFEKQRRMSWVLHRRKKMEMSADMLSRPTYRPARTESMDLIQKEIHEITLGNNQRNQTSSIADKLEQNRLTAVQDDVVVPLKTLFPRQRIFVYFLKLQENAQFLFPVYLGLWLGCYGIAYYQLKTKPFEYQRKFMDLLDISSFQTFHQVIDSNAFYTDALLAFGITSATDLIRLPLLFLATSLFYNSKGTITLTPEAYKRIRYRYEFEERPEPEYDVSKIDPNVHHGIVNHPGTNPIPRGDYYGRDRQRDLIPKDRIDLEYVLHSWQRTNMVRHKREALVQRQKSRKKKIAGPRWAKSGIGIFKRF